MKKIKYTGIFISILLLTILSACGGSEGASGEGDGNKAKKATLITNWFAQPEHGGNYAALKKDFYKDEGIDVTVEPGGPKISSTQIVASGKAQFGYSQAEDILIARDKGIPLVVIGAIFQKSPYVFISHEESGVKDFSDLNGKNVFTAPGVGYWEYIKKKYKLEDAKELSYTGQLNTFIDDPKAVTQGYITSEPFALDQQGVKNSTLLIHDSGFQPYGNVIFTTEDTIKDNPELVQAFMNATVKGWDYYKDHSDEINPFLQEKNPDLDVEAMKYGAKAQKELIFGGDAQENGFGYMSEERWTKLRDQLLDLKIIKNEEDVSKAYTTEFLPGKQ
ncbi:MULTISPECIES: ABC transporter substrate-binding protein [Bacillus]|uniref:Myristoyl transferase n=2 Tax=Bacillus TaxID=1386 RepID=A0A0M5JLL4_9BACI|nr:MULTISPECIES: ABC transporter substrate-binding protein [Bacillus]ALC81777.1 myristoyl transferase [Bacillus gobiensis]MBP1080877.1 NitT/TauT family transport system substrate-binding protein [Bacillus capparidis]MED1097517.1 ABC transporter substrate-binding protein [Bacillus capparidis]